MGKWLDFIQSGVSASGKTGVWEILTKDDVVGLGFIKWWAPWRKYAFFPYEDTVLEQDCLRDIANFIDQQMKERKHKK